MKPSIFFAEVIGTFALVFIGSGAAAQNVAGLLGVALTFGFLITGLIYLFGEISGTHINPAVTFALALDGAMSWRDAIFYWLAQLLGSVIAAAGLLFVFGGAHNGLGATLLAGGISPLQGLIIETICTFLMIITVFFVAVKGHAGKSAGVVIGLTITALILFAAPLTGASFNPARTFGPALFTGNLNQFWIYLLGPLTGAALAVLFYRVMNKKV